jgi:hypothetical protein
LPAGGQHFLYEVDPRNPDRGKNTAGLDSQIAGAGGHIKEAVGAEKTHLARCEATPGDVPTQAEEVVQEIVFAGYGGKDLLYQADALGSAQLIDRRVFSGSA